VIFALVVQVIAYFLRVVLTAVVPVAVHNAVPLVLFRNSLARGYIVPIFAVLLSHNVNVNVEPDGMTPPALGMPLCVSKP